MTATEIVALLGLVPHPEGGWFRETFRDGPGPDGRSLSTAIYYLLEKGQIRWSGGMKALTENVDVQRTYLTV